MECELLPEEGQRDTAVGTLQGAGDTSSSDLLGSPRQGGALGLALSLI